MEGLAGCEGGYSGGKLPNKFWDWKLLKNYTLRTFFKQLESKFGEHN